MRGSYMRVNFRRTFLMIGAFLMLALTPAVTRAQDGSITGTVTDARTGNLVSNASIEVKTANGTVAGKSLSNAGGNYRVSVAPGTYTVSVQIVGYNAATIENVTVASGA